MKKIIASTIAAGLIAGTTLTATAAPAVRDAANVAQSEELGEGGSAGSVLIVLLGAALAAGAVFLIEDDQDADVPVSA